jgi:hypothetical protein
MRELYRGWRAMPEGSERWWDEALNGLGDRIGRKGQQGGLEGALEVKGL